VYINNAINRFLASCGCSPATVKLDNITFNSRTVDVDIKDFVENLRRFNEIDLEVNNIDDKHAFINEIKELRKTSSVIKTLKIDGAMTAVFSLSRKVLRRSSSSSS
jgi:RNA-binding protein YlmH